MNTILDTLAGVPVPVYFIAAAAAVTVVLYVLDRRTERPARRPSWPTNSHALLGVPDCDFGDRGYQLNATTVRFECSMCPAVRDIHSPDPDIYGPGIRSRR